MPNDQPAGTVVSQSPKAGSSVKRGSHVLVNTSLGPKPAAPTAGQQPAIPDVTGEDEQTATQDLQSAGFTVKVVAQDTTDATEDGIVVNQDPPAGQTAQTHAQVTIYVARYSGG